MKKLSTIFAQKAALLGALALLPPLAASAFSFGFVDITSGQVEQWHELEWALPAQLLLPAEFGVPQSLDATIQPTDPFLAFLIENQIYVLWDISPLAVPEPTALGLAAAGLIGLAIYKPRLRRTA